MRMQTVAIIIIPALLITASGCTFYRYEDAPVSALKVIPEEKKATIRISRMVLASMEIVTFSRSGAGILRGETITGDRRVKDVALPVSEIASVDRTPSGIVREVRLWDGTVYKAKACVESAGRYVLTGSTPAGYSLAGVKAVTMRKLDFLLSFLATFAVPLMWLASAIAVSLSGGVL